MTTSDLPGENPEPGTDRPDYDTPLPYAHEWEDGGEIDVDDTPEED